MSCVLPGLPEVFARFLRSQMLFIKEDLPTLERPINAYSGVFSFGHLETSVLLIMNSDAVIRMATKSYVF